MATAQAPAPVTDAAVERLLADMSARPNGPALAALLAAGIGSLVLGLNTTLAEAFGGFKSAMVVEAFKPVGPLAGKTTIAVAAFVVAWAVLGFVWRGKNIASERRVLTIVFVLVAVGLVGTFPIFYENFAKLFG